MLLKHGLVNSGRSQEFEKYILLTALSVGAAYAAYKLFLNKKHPTSENQENYITIKELSDKVKVSEKSISRLASFNKIKTIKDSNGNILLPADILSEEVAILPNTSEAGTSGGKTDNSINSSRILFFQETGKTPEEWVECWERKRFPNDRYNNSLHRRALSLIHLTW